MQSSELRAVELLDGLCERMRDYALVSPTGKKTKFWLKVKGEGAASTANVTRSAGQEEDSKSKVRARQGRGGAGWSVHNPGSHGWASAVVCVWQGPTRGAGRGLCGGTGASAGVPAPFTGAGSGAKGCLHAARRCSALPSSPPLPCSSPCPLPAA